MLSCHVKAGYPREFLTEQVGKSSGQLELKYVQREESLRLLETSVLNLRGVVMYTSYCVAADSRAVHVVEFVSENGRDYTIPMKATLNDKGEPVGYADWSKAGDHRRVIRDGEIFSLDGKRLGHFGSWILCNGTHEFWTDDMNVANAIAESVRLGKTLSPATNHRSDFCYM